MVLSSRDVVPTAMTDVHESIQQQGIGLAATAQLLELMGD